MSPSPSGVVRPRAALEHRHVACVPCSSSKSGSAAPSSRARGRAREPVVAGRAHARCRSGRSPVAAGAGCARTAIAQRGHTSDRVLGGEDRRVEDRVRVERMWRGGTRAAVRRRCTRAREAASAGGRGGEHRREVRVALDGAVHVGVAQRRSSASPRRTCGPARSGRPRRCRADEVVRAEVLVCRPCSSPKREGGRREPPVVRSMSWMFTPSWSVPKSIAPGEAEVHLLVGAEAVEVRSLARA